MVVSLGELRQVFLAMKVFQVKYVSSLFKKNIFLAITRVWCRKSFPSFFEMTIKPLQRPYMVKK